jgi:hypothetical protein
MHKLTTKELTELEDIVRKSIDTFIENSGDTRGEEALKAIAKEKLLKSLHLKVQSMCKERWYRENIRA